MQWFTQKTRASSDEETVTILKTGLININSSAYTAYFKDSGFVLFGYDASEKLIALKPLKEQIDGAYKLRKNKKGTGASASARGFLNKFKIPHDNSVNYLVKWDDNLGAVVFSWDKGENDESRTVN